MRITYYKIRLGEAVSGLGEAERAIGVMTELLRGKEYTSSFHDGE